MQEIEVKARVRNKAEVLKRLASLNCHLSAPISQRDRIFIPNGLTLPTVAGVNVLRIRQQGGEYIFTVKQRLTNQLNCLERETTVDNLEAVVEMCTLLGYFEVSQVNKLRRKCKYDVFEICVDEVEGLGDFIEVEKLSTGEDSAAVQKELFELLESLGVAKTDQVWDGYDVLMYNQKNIAIISAD